MPSSKQPSHFPIILRHDDDDDIITWEHLEDISTPPTSNKSSTEQRDAGSEEARSYPIENVAEMGSRWEMGGHQPSRTGFGGLFAGGSKGR